MPDIATRATSSLLAAAGDDRVVDDLINRLGDLGPIDRATLAAVVADNPRKDFLAASFEVRKWSERERIKSILGVLRKVLADQITPPSAEDQRAALSKRFAEQKARRDQEDAA